MSNIILLTLSDGDRKIIEEIRRVRPSDIASEEDALLWALREVGRNIDPSGVFFVGSRTSAFDVVERLSGERLRPEPHPEVPGKYTVGPEFKKLEVGRIIGRTPKGSKKSYSGGSNNT